MAEIGGVPGEDGGVNPRAARQVARLPVADFGIILEAILEVGQHFPIARADESGADVEAPLRGTSQTAMAGRTKVPSG